MHLPPADQRCSAIGEAGRRFLRRRRRLLCRLEKLPPRLHLGRDDVEITLRSAGDAAGKIGGELLRPHLVCKIRGELFQGELEAGPRGHEHGWITSKFSGKIGQHFIL